MPAESLKTGTTTLGFLTRDAVVLAADRQVTLGQHLVYFSAEKIKHITGKIYFTTAGGVGDNQQLVKLLRAEAALKELETKRPIKVRELAHLTAAIAAQQWNPYFGGLEIHPIIAGVDDDGPGLFIIGGEGSLLETPHYFATGSGSYFILTLLDELYKEDMSVDEAREFAKRLITAAAKRDAFTGSGVDILIIPREGEPEWVHEDFPMQLTRPSEGEKKGA